jgi:hypothetical protein
MELLTDKNGTRIEIGDTVTNQQGKEFRVGAEEVKLHLTDNKGNKQDFADPENLEVVKFAAGKRKLPSTFLHEDLIKLDFGDNNVINDCRIMAVKFYIDKVHYDIAAPIKGREFISETLIYDVDSAFVLRAD